MDIRLDPYYSHLTHRRLVDRILKSQYTVCRLSDRRVVREIIEGRITPSQMSYSEDKSHPIFLRAQNIDAGHLVFSDAKRLKEDMFNSEPKAILYPGDVVLTIDGVLLGVAAVYTSEDPPCCISNHMVRIRPGTDAMPDFICWFLNCQAGQNQIQRGITGSAIPGIRTDAIERILIPIPSKDVQHNLVSQIEASRKIRQEKLAEADELLAGLDDFFLDKLGLKAPQMDNRYVYATMLSQLVNEKRLNPEYFHPERILAIRSMQQNEDSLRVERLEDIANFVRDTTTAETSSTYIGLANVQSHTGELVETAEKANGFCFKYQENDVLFARLRPYLNKVHLAENSGVCSTEFHVIRIKPAANPDDEILPDYLTSILRSSLILAQTRHMMTGNTHPRLANEDVVNLRIPIAKLSIQRVIVKEMIRRREEARRLLIEATKEWDEAKAKFEAQLLGETPS